MTEHLSRRDFLAYSGATLGGVTLGQFGRGMLARADARAATWKGPGAERWTVSVCRECPAACGVRVRLVDNVPVKLEGNPLCPLSRGRLCAKGQAAIESYFDPDRLTGPAQRNRENRWEPITWDAAIAVLAARLRESAAAARPLCAIAVEERGPVADAWARFWTAAGADLCWTPTPTASRYRTTLERLTGTAADPLFDIEHATYVLSFGAPLVEDWLSALWSQRAYGRFRRAEARTRGRLVQIDGHRSLTARKADDWIVVHAERHAALAYGLVAILCRETRVNRSFLEESGGNFAEFERAVVARYTPDVVSAATGVPVVTLLRLARELVATAQPLVITGADADSALAEAVFSLNAVIGAFDRPGGIAASLADPLYDAPRPSFDAERASAAPPRIVALRDPSPLRSLTARTAVAAAIERAEFVVSFSPYLDETSAVAHLLMPVHTPLESWHAVVPASCAATPGQALAMTAPAVDPRLETRDLLEILQATAVATGGGLAAACDWTSSADAAAIALQRLSGERRGTPFASSYETEWIHQLEHGGWWTSAVPSTAAFSAGVLEAGGWLDPFFERGRIRRSIRQHGGLTFPLSRVSTDTANPSPVDTAFPLHVDVFTPATVSLTGNANQAALFELLGQPEGLPWRVWAEIGTDTARTMGIENGAQVRIASAHGEIDAIAVLVDGMAETRVALASMPHVAEGGRWARHLSADVSRLWPEGNITRDPLSVRVSRL